MIRIMIVLCLLSIISIALAEPLPLTFEQMARLQTYFPQEDNATNRLVWNGDPLELALPLNHERRVIFPERVSVNVGGALTTDELRIINDNQSLYFTALKPFADTRLYITLEASHQVILLDIRSVANAPMETVTVSLPAANTAINVSTSTKSTMESTQSTRDVLPTLIRFAWQNLYAPKRLLMPVEGLTRVPMQTTLFVSNLIYGNKVIAHPVFSYTYGNSTVTAVLLHNAYAHPTDIHPQTDICGEWLAAALYPYGHLKAQGEAPYDSTTLFLISQKPFNEALEVCHGHA